MQPEGSHHFTCNFPFQPYHLSPSPHVSYMWTRPLTFPWKSHTGQSFPDFVTCCLLKSISSKFSSKVTPWQRWPWLLLSSAFILYFFCAIHLTLLRESTLYTCLPPVDCELLEGGWFLYPLQPRTVAYKREYSINVCQSERQSLWQVVHLRADASKY